MARPPHRPMMTPDEAKLRLKQLVEEEPSLGQAIGRSVARSGAWLGAGYLAGRFLRRGRTGSSALFLRTVKGAAIALTPILLQEFVRGISRHSEHPNTESSPPAE